MARLLAAVSCLSGWGGALLRLCVRHARRCLQCCCQLGTAACSPAVNRTGLGRGLTRFNSFALAGATRLGCVAVQHLHQSPVKLASCSGGGFNDTYLILVVVYVLLVLHSLHTALAQWLAWMFCLELVVDDY
eukprot:TRINITY_DN29818_c0_g1_i2.p1 TRINITY_DN29818_c0_g1~~TRINITY_DN29818_c0_g1_i2.p1  ORF type:complete len:132 (+),score=9.68 TRINITY_DN29818_c0_g1_i2:265-660(+)